MYGEPKQYRKKPVVIEAMRWMGNNWPEITEWHEGSLPNTFISFELDELKIKTLEGVMTADLGDWIIKGVRGEFYPCKDEIFKATYEPV